MAEYLIWLVLNDSSIELRQGMGKLQPETLWKTNLQRGTVQCLEVT